MQLLIFPHQLFDQHPGFHLKPNRVCLIEDSLFFRDWNYRLKFHKQKLWLHRASMKRFESEVQQRGFETTYRNFDDRHCSLDWHLNQILKGARLPHLAVADPTDFILEKRIRRFCESHEVKLTWLPNPGFLNEPHLNSDYRATKNRWFMADFYKFQRRRLDILMTDDGQPGRRQVEL